MTMRLYISLLLLLTLPLSAAAGSGQHTNYDIEGKTYEGYYVDAGKDSPLVFLIHDWDGLTGYEIKRAHMLAELGFSVFAADLFGKGIRPVEIHDKRQHTGELYKDRQKMRTLMQKALAEAKSLGANTGNAVAAGYCFGGAAVLELARSGADLKGFVTFHGGLKTPEGQDYSQAGGAFLILHGSADTAITLDEFADLGKQLETAGLVHEMITYGGANHAFTVFDSDRYNASADKKSWARFTSFLNDLF